MTNYGILDRTKWNKSKYNGIKSNEMEECRKI